MKELLGIIINWLVLAGLYFEVGGVHTAYVILLIAYTLLLITIGLIAPKAPQANRRKLLSILECEMTPTTIVWRIAIGILPTTIVLFLSAHYMTLCLYLAVVVQAYAWRAKIIEEIIISEGIDD